MSFRFQAASLALLTLMAAAPGSARAQFGNLYGPSAGPRNQQAQNLRPPMRVAQNTYSPQPTPVQAVQQHPMMTGPSVMQMQPQSAQPMQGHAVEDHMLDGGYSVEGDMSGFGGEGYPGYGAGCCDECGGYGGSCLCPPGVSLSGGSRGQFFVTADYLYVRANFSEAVAYLIHDPSNAPEFFDEFHELDFQYESSFRIGGGYELACCDEQMRFMFTRMSSFAEDFTDDENAIGAFETSPGPGGTLDIYADVDAASFDFEYAKTIRLGGQIGGCGCADSCGCSTGDPCSCGECAPCCPEWAVTWSGGLRFADVDWTRWYFSQNPQTDESRDALSTMEFRGGGPRFGLEGRRYFGPGLCGSIYMKGDISLLLGDVHLRERRVVADQIGSTPDTVQTQTATFRNVIPVTEIETGMSVEMVDGVSFSTGYLLSAWHDLGFRDQFAFGTFLETNYDDANILAFDGFFARIEARY